MKHLHTLILLLLATLASAQSPQVQSLMDRIVKEEAIYSYELAELEDADLRILRNTAFARHGYRFKSKDLQELFASQKWYYAFADNVDGKLTEQDRNNIQTVKDEEQLRSWTAEMSAAPRGDTVTLTGREPEMVGMWHGSFVVASGYSERYHFLETRWVVWVNNEMDCGTRLSYRRGRWYMDGNIMHLEWWIEQVNETGLLVPADGTGSCGSDSILEGGEWVERRLKPYLTDTAVIGPVEETDEMENNLPRITWDGGYLWRMDQDPWANLR